MAGAAVGALIVRARTTTGESAHPYWSVLAGLLLFQVVALIPFIGGAVAIVAGLIGGGALSYRAWHSFRDVTPARPAMSPVLPVTPAV